MVIVGGVLSMAVHPGAIAFDYSNVIYQSAAGLNHELLLFLCSAVKSRFPLYILTSATGW